MGSGAHIGWMSASPWIRLLPFLFLQSVVMAHLDCTYNSWTLLSCSWDVDSNFTSSPCYISATLTDDKGDIQSLCLLTPHVNPRSCAINVTTDGKPIKEIVTADHKLNMSVICGDGTESNTSVTSLSEFSAYRNLLLDPPVPSDMRRISYRVWELTWNISHSSKIKHIETEICYKPVSQLWQDALNVKVLNVNVVKLENLHPDTQYEAKVRVNQTDFPGGRWSNWSKPVQWTTPPEGIRVLIHAFTSN
ncbi:interleukin-2 receptor subunit beta-like [Dendropsophus ebraccatus]|uniref:interleukin-2 receptor subunit beta-like n=1 Tax=Dendropsophus ebraccatus TaxID=150705 RepID=UPI0038314F12